MNVLIVYAGQDAKSFNDAMRDVAIKTFKERGDTVKVTDLYEMNFKATADRHDFKSLADPDHFVYQNEQKSAIEKGTLVEDIVLEVEKVKWADLIILQFPLWWFSVPAIMKGWIDRVMINGLFYGGGKWYSEGGLKGKKAMVAMSTGGPESTYGKKGINLDIASVLAPIEQGIFNFTGMDAIEAFVAYSVSYVSREDRKALLEKYRNKLLNIEKEPLKSPAKVEDYS